MRRLGAIKVFRCSWGGGRGLLVRCQEIFSKDEEAEGRYSDRILFKKGGKRRSLGTILIKKEEYGLFKSSRFALENLPVKRKGNTIEEELTDSDIFLVSFDVCDLLSFSLGLLQFGFQRKDANPAVDFHVKHRKKVLLVCLHVCFTGRALFQSLNECLRASRYLYLTGHAKESEGRSRDCFNFFLLCFPRLFGLDFFWLFVLISEFADSTCRFYCSIYYAEQFRSLRKRIFPDGEEK